MNILIIGIVIGVIFFMMMVMSEIINYHVYGPIISEEKLDVYFGEYFTYYSQTKIDRRSKMFYGPIDLPYIAPVGGAIISKWYIGYHCGLIPRWSKWSKKLDQLSAEQPFPISTKEKLGL